MWYGYGNHPFFDWSLSFASTIQFFGVAQWLDPKKHMQIRSSNHMAIRHVWMWIGEASCLCQRGENRACSRADFFNCCMFLWGFGWGGGGVGGDVNVHWTCTLTWCYATARSLQFTQRRDATLLHVLFNLHNDVMLRYCTFSSIYTLTRCYATARSLQFTQLRDATLTGVGGWVGVITSMLTPSWSLRL